jgi:flagellar motor switch protein FliN/FliY
LARDIAGTDRRRLTAWLTVLLGGDAFDARVTVPSGDVPAWAGKALSRADWRERGDFPIALPLLAGTCVASHAELAALERGDVLLVPGWALRAHQGGQLLGPVALVSARGERGLAGELADPARLVIRTETVQSHPWDIPREAVEELAMSEAKPSTLEVLEDASIVVRVELGAVEMKASEWAGLGEGDVIALGRKLGDPAILRVGGVEVARGELVQVDGEYGVRILRRGKAEG